MTEPWRQLALVRSWDTTILLVKNGPLSAADIDRIQAFADQRSFDLAYYPGMHAAEANRFNLLERPYFFEGGHGADRAGAARTTSSATSSSLVPATDDRPYFFDFFKWQALPELLDRSRCNRRAALLDWGYLILSATLLQAAPS